MRFFRRLHSSGERGCRGGVSFHRAPVECAGSDDEEVEKSSMNVKLQQRQKDSDDLFPRMV
jgi:hypothetical protein